MSYAYPRIALMLDGMKASMIQALAAYNSDIEGYVAAELEKVIAAFDYEAAVRAAADAALATVVGDAVRSLIGWQLREEIHRAVREMVAARLNGREE